MEKDTLTLDPNDTQDTTSHAGSDVWESSRIIKPYVGYIGKTSFIQILIHLFKSNIGVGLLNMPFNMSKVGIIFGPIISLLFIIPVVYATFTLLKCSREIKRKTGKQTIGYAGTFKYALMPYIAHRAKYIVYVVNFFLVLTQLGICIVYIIFMAETLQEVTEGYFKHEKTLIMIIGALILLPSLISNLEVMSVLSGGATAFCLISLAFTFYYIFRDFNFSQKYIYTCGVKELPSFLSTLLYAYEGINVIIPLDNEIENPDKYPLAIKISTFGTTFLYFSLGLVGYLVYGTNTKSSITFNLPVGILSNTTKIVYALGVIFTFFIQFHVAMRAILPTIIKRIPNKKTQSLVSSIARALFVILITILAIAIPQLDQAIALIGALGCTALGLIFPSIIHLSIFWYNEDNNKLTKGKLLADVAMIVFGTCLLVSGVCTSIASIVSAYQGNTN